jgi:hypothetical protein
VVLVTTMQVFLLGLLVLSVTLVWAQVHIPKSDREADVRVALSTLSTRLGPPPRIADPDEGLVTDAEVHRWLRPETSRSIKRGF